MSRPFVAVADRNTQQAFPCWDDARDWLRRHGGRGAVVRRVPRWTGERWVWRDVMLERFRAA